MSELIPQIPASLFQGAYTYAGRVDSWLGSRWLGRVPVAGGSVSFTTGQQVQGSLSLTVPRVGSASEDQDERDWTPIDAESPLACCGQVLHVAITVTSLVTAHSWTLPAGRFLITATDVAADRVSVTGKSLLHRLEEDRFVSPMVPRSGGTLASEARRVLAGYAGLVVHRDLTDRRCPSSMTWGESRIDALYEIADAWPARLREGRDGLIRLLPPLPDLTSAPERVLTDGEGGTVVGIKRASTRDKRYNRVVARSQATGEDGQPSLQAVADQTTGPLRVDGPYGVVTRFFSSPLITSYSGAAATASSLLATSVRGQSTIPLDLAPDPTLFLDDAVTIRSQDIAGAAPVELWGRISALDLPLTWEGKARVDVEVTSR